LSVFRLSFQEVSDVRWWHVENTFNNSPPKTCTVDPLLTFVLRNMADVLLPLIWVMCSASLWKATFLNHRRLSLRQSPNVDSDELKNYRLVSNVTCLSQSAWSLSRLLGISKTLTWCFLCSSATEVTSRLKQHLSANHCCPTSALHWWHRSMDVVKLLTYLLNTKLHYYSPVCHLD